MRTTTLMRFGRALLFSVLILTMGMTAVPARVQAAHRAGTADITAVTTYKYDTMLTGQNPYESTLTTTNVTSFLFGKRVTYHVDGQVYAQPLFIPHLNIN